jgi:hypothetical protein
MPKEGGGEIRSKIAVRRGLFGVKSSNHLQEIGLHVEAIEAGFHIFPIANGECVNP